MISCVSTRVITHHISYGLYPLVAFVVNEYISPACSVMSYFEADPVLSSVVFKECHAADPVTPSSSPTTAVIGKMIHWKFVNEFLSILRNRFVAGNRRNLGAHFSDLTTHFPNRFPTRYRIGMLATSQKNRHCQQSAEC